MLEANPKIHFGWRQHALLQSPSPSPSPSPLAFSISGDLACRHIISCLCFYDFPKRAAPKYTRFAVRSNVINARWPSVKGRSGLMGPAGHRGPMSWNYVVELCCGIMLWNYAMKLCCEIMPWNYVVELCREIMLWNYVVELWVLQTCRRNE